MIIKNARIYGKNPKDIIVEKGIITKINECGLKHNQKEILDAKNLTLLPSFVDLNVSLKNDKFSLTNLELLENECLKGGVGAIILRDCMDFDEESFELFLHNLKQRKLKIFTSVKIKENKNLATLINKGAFCLECESSLNANLLRLGMQYALMKDVPVFVRCYDEDFDDNGVMNDCAMSFELGLSGMSGVAEISEVAKIKEIAKFYKSRVVFDLLSLENSLNLLSSKEPVLVGLHHLIKDDKNCEGFNTAAKIMPPLRAIKDMKFLKNALKKGKINFLSAMHSPKSISLKDLAFDEAAFGIHSICEFISLCYTFLVKEGLLSWEELCKATSKNPSEFLGLNSGEIKLGKEANLVLFDETKSFKPNSSSLYAKDTLFGAVKAHIIKGKVFDI